MKKSLKIVVLAICLMVTACFTACTPLKADSAVKKLLDKGYQTVSMETLEKEDFVELELDLKGGAYYVSAQKKVQSGGTTAYVRVYIFDKTSDAKKVYDEIIVPCNYKRESAKNNLALLYPDEEAEMDARLKLAVMTAITLDNEARKKLDNIQKWMNTAIRVGEDDGYG